MNSIKKKISILGFAISNPILGRDILEAHYDLWQDSKKKKDIHEYSNEIQTFFKILKFLFPHEVFRIEEFKSATEKLQQHAIQFYENLKKKEYPSKDKPYQTFWALEIQSALFLYAFCRLTKPEKVVETGVAYGMGSSFILQALHDNQKGELFSIDSTFTPWQTKEMIGVLTPKELRYRRKFEYGSSSKKLKKLLSKLGEIDIFFHDSMHTYRNMLFEFETAWPFLKKGGFIVSDDVLTNNAFYDFHTKVGIKPLLLSQKNEAISSTLTDPQKSYFGILRKE